MTVGQQFGRNVRRERERAGMPKQELSRKIGVSPPYIHKLESGHMKKNGPGIETVLRIADVLTGGDLTPLLRGIKRGGNG